MQSDPSERLAETPPKSSPNKGLIIGAIVAVVVIAAWLLSGGEDPAPAAPQNVASQPVPEPEPEPELPPAADIPEPEPEPAPEPPPEPEEPPLTLDNSDTVVREQLAAAVEDGMLSQGLSAANLLERGAAVIDSLSRGNVQRKLLPLPPPSGKFSVVQSGGQEVVDPASYSRYDSYAKAIAEIDTATLASSFHRFRPLLEESYAALGYSPDEVDNALIRALDRIIATPELSEPPAVRKVEAVYKYVNPELEKLPELQKQLLRMGPDNLAKVKAQARALRAALLGEAAAE